MTREEFAETFAFLCAAFPNKEIPKETWQTYYVMLKDIPIEIFRRLTIESIAKSNYFPTVHALREAACEYHRKTRGFPDAYTAWGEVLRLMRSPFEHILLSEIASEAVADIGGFAHLRESQTLAADRARFIDAYERKLSLHRESKVIAPIEQIERISGDLDKLRAAMKSRSLLK